MDYSMITGDRFVIVPVADATPTITVTSNAEYVAAVAALKLTGGTIKVDTSDGAFRLDLNRIWNSEYIVVTSADPENPATILGMNISKISNMTFTGLSFETGDPLNKSGHAVHMQNTTDIAFVGNTITGSVTGRLGVEDTEKAGGAIYMSGVTNTVLADNTITAVSMGISTIRSENTLIQGNVLTELQMDVMRVVSSVDTVVDRNVVDRLFGSTATENHDDILQYWQVNGSEIIRNLTVTNNYFNAGDASYQGIFGGGGMKDTGGATGLVIDNNLIITGGTIHGITANYFTDARITNNTLLNNADALNFATPDSVGTSSTRPYINLFQLENVEVSGNIGFVRDADPHRSELSGTIVIENNIDVDYADMSSPFYVDKLFVNVGTGGVKDLRDFQAIDGSVVDGVGSSLTNIGDSVTLGMNMSRSTAFAQVFDFSVHAPRDGVSYVWTTEDGRTFAGTEVSICFAQTGRSTVTLAATGPDGAVETVTRDVTSVSAVVFDFDPVTGFPPSDAGTGKNAHMTAGDPEITMSQDGTRMVLLVDADDQFGVNRLQKPFRAMEAFSIQLEFRQDTPDVGGILLHKRDALRVKANADGSLYVSFNGPDNKETMTTEPGVLSDTGWHTLTLSYDGSKNGTGLTVRLDDVDVAVLDVRGVVDMASYPIVSGAYNGAHLGFNGEIGGLRVLNIPTSSDAEVDDPLVNIPSEIENGSGLPLAVDDAPSLLVTSGLLEDLVRHVDVDAIDIDMLGGLGTVATVDGAALVFDGTARTSFDLGPMDGLVGSDAFTIAMSLGIDDAGQSGRILFAPGFISMSVDSSGMVSWRTTLRDEDGIETPQRGLLGSEASAVLSDGDMHRLVLSYAGDAGALSVWLDGVLIKELEMSGTVGNFAQIMLGNSWGSTFVGHVADVAVFRDAADADRIAEDFTAFAVGNVMGMPPEDDLATIDVAFDVFTPFVMDDQDDDSAYLVHALAQASDESGPDDAAPDTADPLLVDVEPEPELVSTYEDAGMFI